MEYYQQATQVSIENDSGFNVLSNSSVIQKLAQNTKLEKLFIGSCRQITQTISQAILQQLQDNQLKYLTLYQHQSDNFPNDFIKNLCKKFPQLKQFHHYELSNSQYLQKYQQERQFIVHEKAKFQLSLQQNQQLSNLKQLQNIFICEIEKKRSANVIKNMKKSLKHVCLYSNERICQQLFQELLQIKQQLESLSLINLEINQDDIKKIMKIIQNNPNIETLVLSNLTYSYQYINGQFIYCIGHNLKNLKKLIIENSLSNQNKIQEKDFQMLQQCSQLKLLNLSYFDQIDKQGFKKTISELKNITYLTLKNDKFLDDEIMSTIGQSLQKLEVLSLHSSNNITGKGLLQLKNLLYLNTLILYENTEIKGEDMIQLSKNVTTIKNQVFHI